MIVVPLSSRGPEGATVVQLPAGESGLPGTSYVKGHFIQILPKQGLITRERRMLSNSRMRDVVMAIRRSFDPDAAWPEA